MASRKHNMFGLPVTKNADGAQIAGGTIQRILKWLGADITLTGSGSNTHTFPNASTTLAGLSIAQIWSARQTLMMGAFDVRSSNPMPQTYEWGIKLEFRENGVDGLTDGGLYHAVLTYRQWSTSTDWSGGGVHQFAYTDNGNTWYRYGSGTDTWGAWTKMLNTVNIAGAGIDFANGTLKIPHGSAPTVSAEGHIGVDTTDDQLLVFGSALFVAGAKKKSTSVVIPSPAVDTFTLGQVPYGITITNIRATNRGGTSVTFNIEERASNALGSAGTNVMTSSLTSSTTGANTSSFSNADIASNAFLVLVASAVSGTVGELVIEIDYTINRT